MTRIFEENAHALPCCVCGDDVVLRTQEGYRALTEVAEAWAHDLVSVWCPECWNEHERMKMNKHQFAAFEERVELWRGRLAGMEAERNEAHKYDPGSFEGARALGIIETYRDCIKEIDYMPGGMCP